MRASRAFSDGTSCLTYATRAISAHRAASETAVFSGKKSVAPPGKNRDSASSAYRIARLISSSHSRGRVVVFAVRRMYRRARHVLSRPFASPTTRLTDLAPLLYVGRAHASHDAPRRARGRRRHGVFRSRLLWR